MSTKRRAAALAAAAAAGLVLVVVELVAGGSGGVWAELEERARVDAALSQLLSARRAAKHDAAPFGPAGKEEVKARMALRALQRSLQGELGSVDTLLSELHGSQGRHTSAAAPTAALSSVEKQESGDGKAAWEKRTMQRGAMRGESTQRQLTRVLEKDLSDKIQKKLHWKKSDLESAAGFAKYLQTHPLPEVDDKPEGPFASLQDTASDSITGQEMDDGVVKVTFKREMKMTEEQYR